MYCSRCKSTERLHVYYTAKNKNGTIRQYYLCAECSKAKQRKYNKTESGKAVNKKAQDKYRENNLERRRAYNKSRYIEAKSCQVCGDTAKIHRHHPDINQPEYIVPLCPFHHRQAHKLLEANV